MEQSNERKSYEHTRRKSHCKRFEDRHCWCALQRIHYLDAVICLGAVIRGATSHYDLVCNEAAKGIAHVSLDTGVPVMFGIVTTDTIEQAIERAGTKAGNKGFDCATGAIEMVNLLKSI